MAIKKLRSTQLKVSLPEKALAFKTTDDLQALDGVIGQARAVRALQLGLEIEASGYNIFVTGPAGTGRTTIVKQRLNDHAKSQKVPDDWCYVYNFSQPDMPRSLSLPAGKGRKFHNDMSDLIDTVRKEINRAFSGEHYEQQKAAIVSQINQQKRDLLQALEEKGLALNLKIQPTSMGFQTIPIKDNQPISPEAFSELSDAEKESIKQNIQTLEAEIADTLRQLARLDIRTQKLLNQLDKDVARFVADQYIKEMKEDYNNFPHVIEYIDSVARDIIANTAFFFDDGSKSSDDPRESFQDELFKRYRVNVVVDNGGLSGAPVIYETNPTYNNLIGRIEKYPVQGGGYATDFSMIKAGSLLKANGGYLMADAEEVLRNPFVYEALKRSLRNGCLSIEDVTELYGTISIVSLKPQPIPLKIKVVLVGWNRIYQLLNYNDDDFSRIFKVRADFDYRTAAKGNVTAKYARFIKRVLDQEGLPPFDRNAVGQVIEYGHRLAENQDKISLEFGQIIKIVEQAAFWAKKDDSKWVAAEHVKKAVLEYENRHGRIQEAMQESIRNNIRKIKTDGELAGEINALSVYQVGEFAFGLPSRITAKTYMGNDTWLTIERKVGLSGKIHDKGTYILSGYFNSVFGDYLPLNFSASLTFEQSYGRIDGDSASSTELYALLSSLANVPIKQGIAVTGSVNQNGEVQAIGGVNEKIEGFFEVCQHKGLTGGQGVMIPRANVKDLMLKDGVIDAVEAGRFHIWTVDSIEDGIKLLMNMRAGKRNKHGHFPKNTLFYKVEQKIREFSVRSEIYKSSISDEHKKRTGKDKKKNGNDSEVKSKK